jgi:hypothetical protein
MAFAIVFPFPAKSVITPNRVQRVISAQHCDHVGKHRINVISSAEFELFVVSVEC